ncbi:MAG: hypothetical protein PHF79_01845 [Candidatus Pacebacteria bacterium]|nr:hypothetical protein [Candidatus Paceibacterota bacterium]
MKKLYRKVKLVFILSLCAALGIVIFKHFAPGLFQKESGSEVSLWTLIPALIEVESGGDDSKVGDRGMKNKAYGCLQIRQPCMNDVNRSWRQHHKAEECLNDRELSVNACQQYLCNYGRKERLGHEPTMQDLARIWNGGPDGWKNPKTEWYWEKVQQAIQAQQQQKANIKRRHPVTG